MPEIQEISTGKKRQFLPADFEVNSWDGIAPYFEKLSEMPLDTVAQVEDWLLKSGELNDVIGESGAWRYIRMTRDTNSQAYRESFEKWISEMVPKIVLKNNELNQRLYNAEGFKKLDPEKYLVLIRALKKKIELFREANIPLFTEHQKRAREFDTAAASMKVELDGQTYTLQKAASMLESSDRDFRQRVWEKITQVRLDHAAQLDALLTDLIRIRTQIAQNAGFSSYADYKFQELGRFDYSRSDAMAFHQAVEKIVTPLLLKVSRERAKNLGVDQLRPWDLTVDEFGRGVLKPFADSRELIDKVSKVFERMDGRLGGYLKIMEQMGHLDLESRMGKAPGGYNYTLPETGVPFIFMNAVGTQGDLTVMLHECGHAVHSFSTQHIRVSEFKHLPAEIAELASMSMELIALDFLDEFYPDPAQRARAKREQIMRPITLLPWIASIDCFQFWLHDNPDHSSAEREAAWIQIFKRFHGDYVAWDGYERVLATFWNKQGHIFEVPFYYIEYGIAQLGAIAVWRNYHADAVKGINQYLAALSLGYSRPIPDVYQAAGVQFGFSGKYVQELMDFMDEQMKVVS